MWQIQSLPVDKGIREELLEIIAKWFYERSGWKALKSDERKKV